MAKFTVRDLFTKLSNVFKTDIYILQYRYCIGGEDSEDKNVGHIVCVLNPDCMRLLKEAFPGDENEIIYLKEIKKDKDKLDTYTPPKLFESAKKELFQRRDEVLNISSTITEWKSFSFTDDVLLAVFKNGETIDLFTDDETVPSVTISKSLFPLVTEKKAMNLYYALLLHKEEDKQGLNNLITSFDTEWFQMYSLFQFIAL